MVIDGYHCRNKTKKGKGMMRKNKEKIKELDNSIRKLESTIYRLESKINNIEQCIGTNPFHYKREIEIMYHTTQHQVDIPLADVLFALCDHLGVSVMYKQAELGKCTIIPKTGEVKDNNE